MSDDACSRKRRASSDHTIDWSDEDKKLITEVVQYFSKYPAMSLGGAKYIKEINEGPNSPRAKTRELQKGLRLMIKLIKQVEGNL